MVAAPFLPDESKPADDDIVSQFPAVERLFRDIIESWLLVDHSTDGEHTQVTLPERAGDPSNATDIGFLYTKDDSGDTELFYEDDDGAVVQITLDGAVSAAQTGVLEAPANTSMIFYQSAAPAGWTKDTASTLNNHALRLVTSQAWGAGSQGSDPFSTVFNSSKAVDTHVLGIDEIPAHTHAAGVSSTAASGSAIAAMTDVGPLVTGPTGGGGGHTHTIVLDVNYIDVIRATKN